MFSDERQTFPSMNSNSRGGVIKCELLFLSVFFSSPFHHPLSTAVITLAGMTDSAHGFFLCRSSLKSNTGTRSHLPSMVQMPHRHSNVPAITRVRWDSRSHLQGRTAAPALPVCVSLHHVRGSRRAPDGAAVAAHDQDTYQAV